MDVKEYLKEHQLLFDGAMGTYLMGNYHVPAEQCERTNLTHPEQVLEIHRAYLNAGCGAIKTNTFGANRVNLDQETCEKVIEAGWKLASQAAEGKFVFADMGPVAMTGAEQAVEEYRFIADQFLKLGAKNFLFETLGSFSCVQATASYIKERDPEAFILVSFAAQPDGFTRSGQLATHLIRQAEVCPAVDAVGLNCVSGARHMRALVEQLGPVTKPLSVMPNAGYPTVLGSRTVYEGDPEYFAGQLAGLKAMGVKILGGCCGTTPQHLAAVAGALKQDLPKTVPISVKDSGEKLQPQENPFFRLLEEGRRKVFAVELDPPESGNVTKFMAGARELQDHGADIITIADCPIARARMDSSILACKIHRELGIQALPHMTCRDRNLNATKALLLGLSAEGIHNVLTVTGDPIPTASRDEVKSVYNFNSRMLARYICGLSETALDTPFQVFGALNLNARNFSVQLRLAQKKEENGMVGFLTQPVLTAQALENLKLARETLKGKLLGGIIPVVSQRNALFMNSEVAGITVDPQIVERYEGLDRAAGEELAVKISAAVAREITPYVDGYYLMTPFGRTGLMGRIMDKIREENP